MLTGNAKLMSLLAFIVVSAVAATPSGRGEGPLLEAVIAMTSGQCPEKVFEQGLKKNCEEQMPELGETYKKLGTLQSVRFEGIKPLPGFEGRSSESYTIIFANGSWLWYLDVAGNGKLAMLWAPDRPLMKQLNH